jgi:uncharacterized protein (TIGR03067 family)
MTAFVRIARLLALGTVVVLSCPAGGAPRLKDRPHGSFPGTWRQQAVEFDGNDLTEANRSLRMHWVVTDTTIRMVGAGGTDRGHWTYRANPDKSPAELDLNTEVDGKPVTYPCIYKVEGDTLTVCLQNFPDRGRPTRFQTTPDGGVAKYVHVRAKAGDEMGTDVPPAGDQK